MLSRDALGPLAQVQDFGWSAGLHSQRSVLSHPGGETIGLLRSEGVRERLVLAGPDRYLQAHRWALHIRGKVFESRNGVRGSGVASTGRVDPLPPGLSPILSSCLSHSLLPPP